MHGTMNIKFNSNMFQLLLYSHLQQEPKRVAVKNKLIAF